MRVVVLALTVLACCGPAWAGKIAFGDMAGWTILVPEDAIPSERYAAEEFARLLKEAHGPELTIATGETPRAQSIFIGPEEGLGDEALCIRIRKDRIEIHGGRPRGVLYGVYEFFERYLGVRFLTPDDTYIPTDLEGARIPCETHRYEPAFSFRWSYYRINGQRPEFAARLRVNTTTRDEKLGGVTPQKLISHSYYRYLPVSKYGKDHPEYFALVNGERLLDVGGGGPEPCVTNPEVIEIITEGVLNEIRANPTMKNIDVSQNDNDAYCRCERCEAVNEREGTPMGANLYLVNAVAEAVEQEFPDVKVGTLAYWYTRQRPKHMKPRDNVQIQLCSIECCTLYPLNKRGIEKNRAFVKDMKQWAKVCDDIWVWNYNTNFSAYDLPFPNLRAIGPNVRFFLRNNVKGVFMQANGNGDAGEMGDLRNYVIARCLWNPKLDSWELAEEFCRLHYGVAAPIIIDYLTYLHDNAEEKGVRANCFGGAKSFGITQDVARNIFDYWQRAMDAVRDCPEIRERVEKASICAYRAMLEAGGEIHVDDNAFRVAYPEEYGNVLEQYVALCKKHGMSRAAEQETLDAYVERIRPQHEGMPVVRLENDVWRVTIIPSLGGTVAEMLHKPTGRHLLRALNEGQFSVGTFEEWGERGYDHQGAYEAKVEGTRATLTRTLDDGSTIVRTIALGNGGTIDCTTTITHNGAEPKEYQTKVHPEFDTATKKKDSDIVAAYIRDGDTWRHFNQDWGFYDGPNGNILKTSAGGAFAYYNYQDGFGMAVRYDPAEYAEPRLWWHAAREQVNLELMTRRVTLEQGASLTYAYTFAFLSEPPG